MSQCKVCSAEKPLVHDMSNPYSPERSEAPSLCFDCWHTTGWKEMKKWYLSGLLALFIGLLPLMTLFMWLLYVIAWKHRAHWGNSKGLYLFIYIPTMLSLGTIPQLLCQLWLMSRYGPKLELMSSRIRFLFDLLPLALWGATGVLALIAFAYFWDGKITVRWW